MNSTMVAAEAPDFAVLAETSRTVIKANVVGAAESLPARMLRSSPARHGGIVAGPITGAVYGRSAGRSHSFAFCCGASIGCTGVGALPSSPDIRWFARASEPGRYAASLRSLIRPGAISRAAVGPSAVRPDL